MPTYIHRIETWNPVHRYGQEEASARMQTQYADPRHRRILRHIYRQSAIDTRHVCVPFGAAGSPFAPEDETVWLNPSTGDRNRVYAEVSGQASVDLARRTLAASPFSASWESISVKPLRSAMNSVDVLGVHFFVPA